MTNSTLQERTRDELPMYQSNRQLTQRSTEDVLRNPDVLEAVRTLLQQHFRKPELRKLIDPFSPHVEARNREIVIVLRDAIRQAQPFSPLIGIPSDEATLLSLFAATIGWGPAQPYLDDPHVQEVKINGAVMLVQESGKAFQEVSQEFLSADDALRRAELAAARLDIRLDASNPQASIPVSFGTRMHVTRSTRVAEGTALICIRRGRTEAWDLTDVLKRGGINQAVYDLLMGFAKAECSMIVAGSTGSGKTTVLEAIANSWGHSAHIITIEDNVREINIRNTSLWTAEYVDTISDAESYGKAAREALRQTPELLLPGELRGPEAGAVLSLLMSNHPVITTLHARTPLEAVERFANYAAQPGAYLYANRRDDALVDSANGFHLAVLCEQFHHIGRRVVSAIDLIDCVPDGERKPRTIPLVRADVNEQGEVVWDCLATTTNGKLVWRDQTQTTPSDIERRIRYAYANRTVQSVMLRDVVEDALVRARQLSAGGQRIRAMTIIETAWEQRRDPRLLSLASSIVSTAPSEFASLTVMAQQRRDALHDRVTSCEWTEARRMLLELRRDLQLSAAIDPPAGWATWDAYEQMIAEGVQGDVAAQLALEDVKNMLQARLWWTAVNRVQAVDVRRIRAETAQQVVQARIQAYRQLVQQGQAEQSIVDALLAQLATYDNANPWVIEPKAGV